MNGRTMIAIIAGVGVGGGFALAGWIIAGLVGEIVGVLLAIPTAAVLGIYIGSHT